MQQGGIAQVRAYFAEAAGAAAKFLARPEGPRVGALAFNGWDTHINEGAVQGRLADLLGALDGAIAAIEAGLGEAWRDTVVALVTEFGRTARINGNDGTDHGTATVALFAGGALKGGRVVADWPGLKDSDLLDNRDLKPTADLRALLKGLLRDHSASTKRASTPPSSPTAPPPGRSAACRLDPCPIPAARLLRGARNDGFHSVIARSAATKQSRAETR